MANRLQHSGEARSHKAAQHLAAWQTGFSIPCFPAAASSDLTGCTTKSANFTVGNSNLGVRRSALLGHHLCTKESTYGLHAKSPNWSMLSRFFRPENCCMKGGPPTRYKAPLLIHRFRCNKQPVHSEEAVSANLSLWGSDVHRCNEGFCLFHDNIHEVQNFRKVYESRT